MNQKLIGLLLGIGFFFTTNLFAQCPEQPLQNLSPQPIDCQTAVSSASLVNYLTVCQTVCINNTGAGASGQVTDLSCSNGSDANDMYIHATNPYSTIPGYDGSLVFRWVDWPNKSAGADPPSFAIHAEVNANLAGTAITVQQINCTDGFVLENAFCVLPDVDGQQFYAVASTLPTLTQLDPVVDAQAGINLDLNDINYWIHLVTSDGGTGDICFESSPYSPGFLCGDARSITLTGTGSTVTGNATGCLCESAIYGGLQNTTNNLPAPCGVESPASVWYEIVAPFSCNEITAEVAAWGGADDYNVAILSGVSCPPEPGTNPITGAAILTPGQKLDPGAVIEASACGTTVVTTTSVPAGTYYVYISGKTERPTFDINVSIEDATSSAGNASSPQNGQDVCSGATFQVSTTGQVLPQTGQNIAWFYEESINFDPYLGEGDYLASGTTNVSFSLPVNTSCDPVTLYIKGIVSDDGISPSAGCGAFTNPLNVTVYPEIGNPSVLNSQCIITVGGRCPNFTVNGNVGTDTYTGTAAEDGNTINFQISNGLAGCDQTFFETFACGSTTCTQPMGTALAICDPADPYNFYIDVTFTPGSATSYLIASSDGSAVPSTGGLVRIGPFANGNTISVSIDNSEDTTCNLPLGSFSNSCNPITCPGLTSATSSASGSACEGDLVILQAAVDQGVINVDYSIQWFANGQPIPGANVLAYNYNFETGQGCSPEIQTFSAEITCLTANAAPSTSPMMTVPGLVTVYPIPKLGIDFFPDPAGCVVSPIDNCGGLVITNTPNTNLMPGDPSVTVNYSVSVVGAPAGCAATGSYVVQCAGCMTDAGNGDTPTDNVFCDGASFSLSTTGTTLENGYAIGYAVSTTNPYNDLETSVADAINTNDILGPYLSGNTPSFTNGSDFGPGTFYFTPFVSLDLDNTTPLFTESGTLTSASLFNVASTTITIPQFVFCQGVTNFDIYFTANQTSGIGNPIDDISGLFNNGGGISNFNDSLVNYSVDPFSQTVYLEVSSAFGADVDYNLSVFYAGDYSFPTRCPSCNDVGNPITYELLPNIILTPATQTTVCDGTILDLTSINPTSNLAGSTIWYDGDPNSGGNQIGDPTMAMPTNGSVFWVLFTANADPTCTATTSITINTTPGPVLNPIPPQPSICIGETVDLTALETAITTSLGIFTWYRGNPQTDPFAVQLTSTAASNQSPGNGTTYFAVFQNSSGCASQVEVTYTVASPPALSSVPPQSICDGGAFDLTTIESTIANGLTGTFAWEDNNGAPVSNPAIASPNDGDVFVGTFTDGTSGCTNQVGVTFDNYPDPALNQPGTQGPICAGESIDLTQLEGLVILSAGTFAWYDGDPTTTGQLITDPTDVTPTSNDVYFVEFEDALTGCSATTSTSYTVLANPALTPPGTQGPICVGSSADLTLLESIISSDSGSFVWYLGDPMSGGTLVSTPFEVFPVAGDQYFVTFEDATTACTSITSLDFAFNSLPVLDSITFNTACDQEMVDLTSYEATISGAQGTFVWYLGDPAMGGQSISDPSSVLPDDGNVYCAEFTDMNGCVDLVCMPISVTEPVSGITASYDCMLDEIVVDFANGVGGDGMYQVAASSPNTDGETIAEGISWEVVFSDGSGCLQSTAISGVVNCLVGVEDLLLNNNLSIYPNPTSNKLHLNFELVHAADLEISIKNILGQELIRLEEGQHVGIYNKTLNLENFNAGIYFITIHLDKDFTTKKVIKN